MKHFNIGLTAALGLPLGIWAADCETTSENDPETGEKILRVNSPEQLDVFGDDCTTIVGHILIESDYSGDFVLNGVSEFKGNISAPLSGYGDKLNAFEMLDLTTIDAIFVPKVVNVRLPSLVHAGNIYLEQSSAGEVDLGSLVEAGHVGLRGDWTGINLGSLQRATQVDISGTYIWDVPEGEEPVSIVVDLPALESANYFGVSGLFESLSLPRLTTIGEHEEGVDYLYQTYADGRPYTYISGRPGLRISSANHIPIEVPELEFLNGSLQVYGNVTSFRLPSLGESDVDIEFNTDTHLHIYSTLESTGYLWLWGNIATVDLPNIEHVDSISIAYGDRLPCNETLLKLWTWARDDYNQYKCFELDDQFLDDSDEGTTPSIEEEDEENIDTDTDNETEVPDTDSSNDTNDDHITETRPSNDSPASEEQDTTDDSTEGLADNTESDETFDGSGGRIVSHTGVAMLIAAVVFFCCC
ncbi:hypothetical protein BJX68DRAFT_239083 [Aspergillus pseudodeflectus]|uniref:GPI-anchored cell wall organization protein Ecm33 n=1 Tax=Aspergillus pseudodeflectus TaxID=176178 RepID=A0ABR4K6J5_9EURO